MSRVTILFALAACHDAPAPKHEQPPVAAQVPCAQVAEHIINVVANTGNVYPRWQVNEGGIGGWDATERVLASHCEGWSIEVRRCFMAAPMEYAHPQPIDDCANMLSADERAAFERDNAAAAAEQTKQVEAEEAAGAKGK